MMYLSLYCPTQDVWLSTENCWHKKRQETKQSKTKPNMLTGDKAFDRTKLRYNTGIETLRHRI